MRWYRAAAEQGLPRAQCNLGWCYEHGRGVEQNERRAAHWYLQAAEQDDPRGMFCMACAASAAKAWSGTGEEAVRWYQKAAEAGSISALCNLGVCYERGEGVEQDLTRAASLYRRAAEQEDAAAQCNLGYLYESGEGGGAELGGGRALVSGAGGPGLSPRPVQSGRLLGVRHGVEKNTARAAALYRQAAEGGDEVAACNLGYLYETGVGVDQSWPDAVKWYTRARRGR